MKTGLRDYDDMKVRLQEIEDVDELNSLILIYAGSAKNEIQVVDLLQYAFCEYIVERGLTSFNKQELDAKMTSYIEAIVECPDLTEEACYCWVEMNLC